MKLLILLFLVSCAQLPGGRSYLAEMSREDRGILEPYKDFPVVVGDSGSWGYSEDVRRMRTPASVEETQHYDLERALQWELADLEEKQSAQALSTYQKYSHHLPTISEKIYYLKLPYHERYSYLEAKGIISGMPIGIGFPTVQSYSQLNLGMSKNEVISLLGRPQKVDIAGNPRFENERWVYAQQGNPQYIYFESGQVGGWE